MAKKKTKKKKKKAKKRKKAKKPSTRAAARDAAHTLAKLAGADTCLLCDRSFRTLKELEEHLYRDHGGITRAEYLKYFPRATKRGPVPAQDVMSADEIYRAMTHMARYGKYPDNFDAQRAVDIGAADEMMLRTFASVVIDAYQNRVLSIIRYLTIGLRREFTLEHALNGSDDEVLARVNRGNTLMKEAIDTMHRMADLIKKVDNFGEKEQPQNRLLIAAQLESGVPDRQEEDNKKNRFQHQVTALTSELHGLVQSFMSTGSEHGTAPPSQIVDVDAEAVEPNESDNGHVSS